MQQEIKVKTGQTIFDLALFCYNDASLVYDLLIENPEITHLYMDITGMTLLYTPKKVIKYEAKENAKTVNKVVTIKTGQNLFDLSLQHYGTIEKVYQLIQENGFLTSILSEDFSSNDLNLGNEKNYINNYYNKNLIEISTHQPKVNDFLLLEDGNYLLQENGYKILL